MFFTLEVISADVCPDLYGGKVMEMYQTRKPSRKFHPTLIVFIEQPSLALVIVLPPSNPTYRATSETTTPLIKSG